jgi:hypothetical protein
MSHGCKYNVYLLLKDIKKQELTAEEAGDTK